MRRHGAELVQVPDVHTAFETVRAIEAQGRTLIHPFEGPTTALGTATLGLELARQVPALDAVIVPIGGGGLCAGVSCAIKTIQPDCRVYGVEPAGADTMHRSFAAGSPQAIERVATIADSLGAPHAAPYSYALCRRHVDALVRIDDAAMRRAMGLLFAEMKLAVGQVRPYMAARDAAHAPAFNGRRRKRYPCAHQVVGVYAPVLAVLVPRDKLPGMRLLDPPLGAPAQDVGADQILHCIDQARGADQIREPAKQQMALEAFRSLERPLVLRLKGFECAAHGRRFVAVEHAERCDVAVPTVPLELRFGQ